MRPPPATDRSHQLETVPLGRRRYSVDSWFRGSWAGSWTAPGRGHAAQAVIPSPVTRAALPARAGANGVARCGATMKFPDRLQQQGPPPRRFRAQAKRSQQSPPTLARIIRTPMETPTLRRVRARGLQARTPAVGRVPSRGVQGREITGLGIAPRQARKTWPSHCPGGTADESRRVSAVPSGLVPR